MTRRSLFKTLLAAPLAALAFWRRKPKFQVWECYLETEQQFIARKDRFPSWDSPRTMTTAEWQEAMQKAMADVEWNPPLKDPVASAISYRLPGGDWQYLDKDNPPEFPKGSIISVKTS